MSDGRKVRLIDTSHAGKYIEVELNDDAAMSQVEAQKQIDAVRAQFGDGWQVDDKIAEVLPQCPELFNEYFDNQ